VPVKSKGKSPVTVKELESWKLLEEFRAILEKVGPTPGKSAAPGGPMRLLSEEDYLSAFLFAQFNPIIDSMRGLCACSQLERVQEEVCSRPISLGSFSEAQSVFGFERLERIFEGLVRQDLKRTAAGPDKNDRLKARKLLVELVDSSVFRALPRMQWAEWRHQYTKTQRAVRLHLKFNLFDQEPAGVKITEGRRCERKALADMISKGEFYVGDRYYGRNYKFLDKLNEAGCGYIMRLYEHAHITVQEDLPLDEQDKAAGVVSDQIVCLGSRERWHLGPVRVVRIEKLELDEPVLVVTNRLEREAFSAALVAEIYRQRWSIELFFRWFKCILGKATPWHWMAESAEGVAIQLYCALIAALLLSRHLGRLPNKRCMEMLRFHAMGMVTDSELERILSANLVKKAS
jgi:hypothetical protein